jgi:hypothetical protein
MPGNRIPFAPVSLVHASLVRILHHLAHVGTIDHGCRLLFRLQHQIILKADS